MEGLTVFFYCEGEELPNNWILSSPPRISETVTLAVNPDSPNGASLNYQVLSVRWDLTKYKRVHIKLSKPIGGFIPGD